MQQGHATNRGHHLWEQEEKVLQAVTDADTATL